MTVGCLFFLLEADLENEGCGQVHREREEQREYFLPGAPDQPPDFRRGAAASWMLTVELIAAER